jgi:hypothetical protein
MTAKDRHSTRLPQYDYREGAFFVTMCTWRRRCLFGKIRAERVLLSSIGEIAKQEWLRSKTLRKQISLDAWVIMPNHLHAVVWHRMGGPPLASETDVGAHCSAPLHRPSRSLGSFVAGFKGSVVRRVHQLDGMASVRVWQRGNYDRVIRSEEELNRTRRYVLENRLRWSLDHLYVADPTI